MSFSYPYHYKWSKDNFDKEIVNLIDVWLNRYWEFEDIIPKLKEIAEQKWLILSDEKLSDLEFEIGLIEDINWRDIRDNETEIKYNLLLRFLNIIHSLYRKNNIHDISTEIAQIIASVLNKNDRDIYHIVTEASVFRLFQSMHWDVSISRKDIIDQEHSPFWETNIVKVDRESQEGITFYQRTSSLYSNLLLFCFQNEMYPKEIEELEDIQWNIVNASDALDSNSYTVSAFEAAIDDDDYRWMQSAGMPFPDSWFSYVSDLWTSKEVISIYRKFQKKDSINELVLVIGRNEVWPLMKALHHLPARSAIEINQLLEVFKRKYKNKYWKPNS